MVKVEAENEEFEAENDSDEEEEEDDIEDNPDDYIPPNKLEQWVSLVTFNSCGSGASRRTDATIFTDVIGLGVQFQSLPT